MSQHPDAQLLAGQRGLVLGVSSERSVGYHCAALFRKLGAEVGISYRSPRRESGQRIASALGATALEMDALDEPSVKLAFESFARRHERIDFLVHTLVHVPQGVLTRPLLEAEASAFTTVMDSSVRSLITSCRDALPWLERSSAARVLALTSAGGDFAIPNYHLVGIAKAALGATVRYLAQELGPKGILCNALCFSIVDTDAAARAIGAERTLETREYLKKRSMTRSPLEFEDVARAAAFLISPYCSNVTGESLNVDGGFSRSYF